jgi:hypothetical protein
MKLLRRLWAWLTLRFRDLFYSTGNEHLDLARVIAGVFSSVAAFAVYWNAIHLGKELDLAATLGGLAGMATALNLGIAAKEWARKIATEMAEKCDPRP